MADPWSAVLDELDRARKELKCERTGAYYRGHSKKRYDLIPSLLRNRLGQDDEHNLFCECLIKGRDLIQHSRSHWETLALLQHYGFPTRLLDWTESFAVALFFALDSQPDEAHVWVLNPFRLNAANTDQDVYRVITVGVDAIEDYFECFVRYDGGQRWPFEKPVFVEIPWANERIRAQRGFFTVHPGQPITATSKSSDFGLATVQSLDQSCPEFVRKIVIPNEALSGARQFLELAGVNQYSVFPDIQGLGSYLKLRYSL